MISLNIKIGIIHDKVKLGAKRTNMKRLYEKVSSLVRERRVNVVVLPSYPITGPIIGYYPPNRLSHAIRNYAERMSERGTTVSQGTASLLRWSEELGVYIVAGPIIERAGPRLYSTVIVTSPKGTIVGKYRKIGITRDEAAAGLSSGRSISVISINGRARLGLFIDDDLAYPEIFRMMQLEEANIIIGFMMPYHSEYFRMTRYYDSDILTMDESNIGEFLSVRARETGLPIILVGGAVNGLGSSHETSIAFMPTIPAEPDIGVVKDKILRYEDLGGIPMLLEVNAINSRPRRLGDSIEKAIRDMCRKS